MMSATYSEVFGEATLQARLSLAKHVYVFKAIDRDPNDDSDSDDGYEGDFGNGSDPFAPPVPSQISRLHDFTKGMYEEVMERLESISNDERGHGHVGGTSFRHSYSDLDGPPGSPGGVEESSTWYRRKRRSHVGKKSHPCTKALTQLRAQIGLESALKSGRDGSLKRLPGAVDKVVTMQRFASVCIGDRCVAACAPGSF